MAHSKSLTESADAIRTAAAAHGGQANASAAEDHGFRYSRDLAGRSGHLWVTWMDPSEMPGATQG